MMEPPLLAATNRFATALAMSQVPRKLVLKMVFHSPSCWSNGVRTGPARHRRHVITHEDMRRYKKIGMFAELFAHGCNVLWNCHS